MFAARAVRMGPVQPKLTDSLASSAFNKLSAREMLIWLYITEHGPGPYSSRDLAAALHARQPNIVAGLKKLVRAKLLEPLDAVQPGLVARYRALMPETGADG